MAAETLEKRVEALEARVAQLQTRLVERLEVLEDRTRPGRPCKCGHPRESHWPAAPPQDCGFTGCGCKTTPIFKRCLADGCLCEFFREIPKVRERASRPSPEGVLSAERAAGVDGLEAELGEEG